MNASVPSLRSLAENPAIPLRQIDVALEREQDAHCSVQQLQAYTFFTKYARYNAGQGRRETWTEAVDRVFTMHEKKYAGLPIAAELAEAKRAVSEQLVLGSQRALQFGGTAVLDKNARMYNCTVSYCDRPRFFQEAMWLLLCGSGVGFSVQKHHVAKLPPVVRPGNEKETFKVDDSIEGWADAVGALMSSYLACDQSMPQYSGKRVTFDYSAVRPAGSPIASGSGKAPGPEPLKRSLERIRTFLDERLAEGGSPVRLRPIDAYDLVMHSSDAVLAGGVRRSATICVFSPDDQEMAKAKTGDWFIRNPHRGRSNNSALLLRDRTTYDDFHALMESVKEFGEPGFVWADSTEVLYNPCVEISMYPVDESTGKSGWQFCNLCEINAKACGDKDTFMRACRAGAILGTLQAGYTSFPYLGEASENITRREALLGVSMTGMSDNPSIAFDPQIQREGAQLILDANAELAAKIGINPCARATCIKPAGTTSCLLGTASGIHPHHAPRYFRNVQANHTEQALQYFEAHNPRAIEPSVWNPNGTDKVITFCIDTPADALVKRDLGAIDLLERVRLTQQNWVDAGKRPSASTKPWLRHNVSNTITVAPHEWEDVAQYIYQNRSDFAGVSLLPDGGDLDYPQAPFVSVLNAHEIVEEYGVGAIMASGLIVDGLKAFNGNLWSACSSALGIGAKIEAPVLVSDDRLEEYKEMVGSVIAKKDWVRRAHKFSHNYFGGDTRRMTHCLKRVHNSKKWEDLTREYVPVDYALLHEGADNTKLGETIACAGGKCDLA